MILARLLTPPQVELLRAIQRGRPPLEGVVGRRTGVVCRYLKTFEARRLIVRVNHSSRYHVTARGRAIIGACKDTTKNPPR